MMLRDYVVFKTAYIASFVLLAAIFVPVDTYYFMGNLIVPCCYLLLAGLLAGEWNLSGIVFGGIYLGLYLVLFYSVAKITFWLSTKIPSSKLRLSCRLAILLIVFSCSFLPVIGDFGYRGRSGTYNFWSATARYFEHKANPRDS